ncbi:hypothetical protein CIL05_06800 [Virgibacillus profundi]|uniref:Uncharacterized protein n=1 Tax=Virgibacillus profundi TaxID=2024555 RepID=A0A2A2IGB9_9BACI|nr:hypothetical protein [Virgibacillus profundi]PAV30170.1 hypothetical protein CIL05_06800 [Virgibacillus profundi]PXY54342.1 hypothetical protein CIT14_06885 [Virgibacillus profundi]
MFVTETHVDKLKNKIFKVLYLFEGENEGLTTYIHSVIYELEGLRYRVNPVQDSMLQTLISDLEHMYSDSLEPEPDLATIRREIFGHMSLLDKFFESGDT